MRANLPRRKFLKSSTLGFGGLFIFGPGAKGFETELADLQPPAGLSLNANTWTRILKDEYGARRFSSFRYAPHIDRFLLWGFHEYRSENYGGPEKPWTDNKEYDMVGFNPVASRWENQFPQNKQKEWERQLPPMHLIDNYWGNTPGHYYTQLKIREGVLRPDLNIVSDQITYDSKRGRMVYFIGGRTYAYLVEKREWVDIGGEDSPPPVSFGSLCYDPFKDRIILFGGGHIAETGPDGRLVGYTGTWVYNCASGQWSRLASSVEPPPRMCTRLVCDTRNQTIVVFGGDAQSSWLGDTWILDLTSDTWRQSKNPKGPGARAGHFAVYDPATGLVIIGGGYNDKNLSDMWGYDTATDSWAKLQGEVPTGWFIAADIIPEKSRIVLTTSTKSEGDTRGCNEIYPVRTTWAYQVKKQGLIDGAAEGRETTAILKRNPEETAAGTAPDPARRSAQQKRIQGMPDNQWIHFPDPGRKAIIRTWGSCAFDTDRGRIITWGGGHCGYGGNDYDSYDVAEHTWIASPHEAEYPERAWDKGINQGGVTFNGSPWMTHGRKIYAYDPVSRKIINMKTVSLTAGYDPQILKRIINPSPKAPDRNQYTRPSYAKLVTWSYDEKNGWEIVCGGLPGLDLTVQTPYGVMAIDYNWGAVSNKTRADMSVWKGQPMVDNSVYLLKVIDRKWDKLTIEGPWPQNLYEMTALVYDSRRNQLILHGAGPERDELWRFILNTGRWEKIEPGYAESAGGYAPVCTREAVYLEKDDTFLTFGGPGGDRTKAGFWAYRVGENRWHKLDIQPPAEKTMNQMFSQNKGWVYDPIHDRVWMVLGLTGDTGRAEMYGLKFSFT
ncbi:MAG TPA: kelch repeat-containing protein [Flavitalea sp.]|nr:kelch repeat-containing protein [Flavitalea sp.]